ncbi:uncharacterized protein LOC115633001 isoform X1 [Scaptodrosophila lebanonensis]|uniref:Uncharacterized protein LOC115633001 isoform X1 n=1 Tax=Drosophila lebanonensis TaxID=7225 RepID=A0A6J2UCJ0_DROLE|nr:uncharacterized protein LOC115633001 isoform X1 [Scaptodrosophila lebanonensis]
MLKLSYILTYCVLLAPYCQSLNIEVVKKSGSCPKLPHPLDKASYKGKVIHPGMFLDTKNPIPKLDFELPACKATEFSYPDPTDLITIGTDNTTYIVLYGCKFFKSSNNYIEYGHVLTSEKGPNPVDDKAIREIFNKNKLSLKQFAPECKQ